MFLNFEKYILQRNKTAYEKKMNGIIAECQVCKKRVKGSLGVSSNFIWHLRKHHPNKHKEFKTKKAESSTKLKRKNSFNQNLLNFIGDTCSPLSVLEHKSFLKLFPAQHVPSRRTITRLLAESHQEFIENIKMILDNIQYVCVTADVWSGGKRSFFGYTCHWLDAQTFERKSVALACRRFPGSHSFDRVAEIILEINEQYGLPVQKILYTITDNGSNFVKAFREFGVSLSK